MSQNEIPTLKDGNENLIHGRTKTGGEWRDEYDDKRHLIYRKWNDGYAEWYDDKGKIIHNIDVDGHEYWFEYDSNGTRSIRRV
jgi:YD repeat-containing protein